MAWRLQEYVTRGEIDNRTRGHVTGRLWLSGVDEPLVLDLHGNCQPDLAGCLLTFENRAAVPLSMPAPPHRQCGRTGDMTASRKMRVLNVPIEEYIRLSDAGLPAPEHLANCLYLEWFSDVSGRMVIESTDFTLQVSTPEWRLNPVEKSEHVEEKAPEIVDTMSETASESSEDDEDPGPWDEFRHEQALRKRDALTEKFGKLLDKYRDHPNRDQIIAREMGWDWFEEGQDGADDELDSDEMDAESEVESGEWVKPEPDPTREGIDWIRTPSGEIRHPLYDRAFQLASGLHDYCHEQGLLENTHPLLEELFSQLGLLAAKLAGALTDLADGTDLYEPGFVVALLKRALDILNHTLAALELVARNSLVPASMVTTYRNELLSIREGVLALVQEFRKRVS